jgi:hypothetical protein
MNELSIWLDSHCSRGDVGVFRTAAELRAASTVDDVYPVSNGDELLALLADQPRHYYDHVVIAGHGGTTWILDDEYGVTTGAARNDGQVTVSAVARELARIMRQSDDRLPLVSLAACMCSRSPTWLLRSRLGRYIGSDWGTRAYLPGGDASFSARLRDYLHYFGCPARVRGHRASGHATALALLAEHSGGVGAGGKCETLFGRCFPHTKPHIRMRRWWVKHVTGRLAQRWLMGDDSVESEIRSLL